ncbi:Ubiquitin carboxyl-terminal hydrolase 34 [Cyphellophora attinorum]|uniref:Ubiquitin carboxyl-terminal hydrolase 34 n=1 Tax=Cyphellophora attinorum TaxID=1664694 RepID=A0A0N1HA80_9EURO|nr:Ubiquitin carboxyl-terminal hydrolase 34 [Phialophora attinorum]KPI39417.1 Ubiquitin carboxyl-terminal hydrolase 34 [Phialophora attinorum]
MSTPPSDTTRNRSDSADDPDLPTHDRKRPRLSANGSVIHTTPPPSSPSIQEPPNLSLPAKSSSPVAQQQASSPKPALPPRLPMAPDSVSSTKVTINTRPLSAQSVQGDEKPGTDDVVIDPALVIRCTEHDESATINGQKSPKEDDPERSPSPVIEIAEPEDVDGDPSHTRWTTRVGGSRLAPQPIHIGASYVHRTFPAASECVLGESYKALTFIIRVIVKGESEAAPAFQRVKDWLAKFVQECDSLSREVIDSERQFWLSLPCIITQALFRCTTQTLLSFSTTDMKDYFIAHGELTKLMMEYDTSQLRQLQQQPAGSTVRTFSSTYLSPLSVILEECLTGTSILETSFMSNTKRLGDAAVSVLEGTKEALLGPGGIDLLQTVSDYVAAMEPVLATTPNLCEDLIKTVDATIVAGQSYTNVLGSRRFPTFQDDEEQKLKIMYASEKIMHTLNDILRTAVKKQHSWLNLENAQTLLARINIIMPRLSVELPRLGQSIIKMATLSVEEADLTYLSDTMTFAWKLWMCWTFMKFGRMELRVAGVTIMGQVLLDVYNDRLVRRGPRAIADPLVSYLIRFLRANDVVKYVIGVDSHPQLASRGGQLVGFFGVAGAYENALTDTMWETILGTPDPRIATEIQNMLVQALSAIHEDHCYYICEKLAELPYEQWDEDFIRLGCSLLNVLPSKLSQVYMATGHPPVNPVVRRLCLKVVRDCMRPANCGTEKSRKLISEWLPRLKLNFHLSASKPGHFDISEAEENEILMKMRDDIANHGEYAGGTILALEGLLTQEGREAVTKTVAEACNLPEALIENTCWVINARCSSADFYLQMDCRIKLLSALMTTVPERFSSQAFDMYWRSLLVNQDIEKSVRHLAWEHLTCTMRASIQEQNAVIRTVLQDYWPLLHPQIVDLPILRFAQEAISYECRFSTSTTVSDNGIVDIPGTHRIRELMLKSPSDSLAAEAIGFLIDHYMQHPAIRDQSKDVIKATRTALLDEYFSIVLGAAARLKSVAGTSEAIDESCNAILASSEEIQLEELRFDRSLLFLRRFTEANKMRDSSISLVSQLPDFPNPQGQLHSLIVEVVGSVPDDIVRKVDVGEDNTGAELWRYLASITGFTAFRVISYGRQIQLQNNTRSIAELIGRVLQVSKNDKTTGVNVISKVQVVKLPNTAIEQTRHMRCVSPIDDKIMLHSDDLYGLLEADDRLAKEIYLFLSNTTVRKELAQKFRDLDLSAPEALSCDKLYKLLFDAEALRSCVEEEAMSANPDTGLVVFAARALMAAISKLAVTNYENPLSFSVSEQLVRTLSVALRTKVALPAEGLSIIDSPAGLLVSLLQYLHQVHQAIALEYTELHALALRAGLESLIEAALLDSRVRTAISWNDGFPSIFAECIFNPDERVRQNVAEALKDLTGDSAIKGRLLSKQPPAASRHDSDVVRDVLLQLWSYMPALIREAGRRSSQSQQFFESADFMFIRLGPALDASVAIETKTICQEVLCAYDLVEQVGKELAGRALPIGVARLLKTIASFLREQNALPSSTGFLEDICDRFLFPAISDTHSNTLSLPLIDSYVRGWLYDMCLSLYNSPQDLEMLLSKMADNLDIENFQDTSLMRQRLSLRSDVGYAGLMNLSNTCYLNSLFSQLFMNVKFRNFIHRAASRTLRSNLVNELAKVFAYMECSYEKAIDPSGAVGSIMTYDGTNIDVTVQMDVDEFFNLLFDRIETGLSDSEEKTAFQGFYGGQIVQQIKSKECSHISERPEPFSVVPIEIKGKASLEDGLKGFVEGETLQGDNKYSCTSCNKHVDAVKRACFKHLPDNLIFNLKRFDYDIMTGARAKLNDRFEFPETIDMAPYTLKSVMNSDIADESDIFELTGVIVHSGSAEIGHYYSYIRECPPATSTQGSWTQFNDADVTRFSPSEIADQCFGGYSDNSTFAKPYNGYMLFYRRREDSQAVEEQHVSSTTAMVLPTAASADLQKYIAQSNEVYVRACVRQDPIHAMFIRNLLIHTLPHRGELCSESHGSENHVLQMVLLYMTKVSMQWKDFPAVEKTMMDLGTCATKCRDCAETIVATLADDAQKILDCCVRSPYHACRKMITSLIMTALTTLRDKPAEFVDEQEAQYKERVRKVAAALSKTWVEAVVARYCWPEYFPLVVQLSQLDCYALAHVLEGGFVRKILEVLQVHYESDNDMKLRQKYREYLTDCQKRQAQHHAILIECLYRLLENVDLGLAPIDSVNRYVSSDYTSVGLSATERHRLGLERALSPWLRTVIRNQLAPAYVTRLVAMFAAESQSCVALGTDLVNALREEKIADAANFIDPAVTYLQNCGDQAVLVRFAQEFIGAVETVELNYGLEFVDFIKRLCFLSAESLGLPEGFLHEVLKRYVPQWLPILLYSQNEQQRDIRQEAAELFEVCADLPANPVKNEEMDEQSRARQRRAQDLMKGIARVGHDQFLNNDSRKDAAMQKDHFRCAIEVFNRCQEYVFPYTGTKGSRAHSQLEASVVVMQQLVALESTSVEVIEDDDEFGSSSNEAGMSDGFYDTDTGEF